MSISPRVQDLAADLMPIMRYSSLSGLVEQLIRDEYERRVGKLTSPPVSAGGTVESALETGAKAAGEKASSARKPRAAAKSKGVGAKGQ